MFRLNKISFVSFCLLLLFSCYGIGQGISFQQASLDQALSDASQTDKPIFIDVYTDWCGPCKRMDQSTFIDSAIGTYFNDSFISLKADAEDKNYGTLIADRYDVSGYPTLLFLSSNGELIMKLVGMQTKYELLKSASEAMKLYNSLDYLKSVKANIYGNYSKEELQGILRLSNNHPFEGKEQLSMSYLDKIDAISEEDLRLVMGEVALIDLPYLRRLTPMTTSLSYGEMSVRRNAKEWFKWRTDTEITLDKRIKAATNGRKFTEFEALLEILKSSRAMSSKQVDQLYYKYYRRNDLDQYKAFASYLVTEYIVPSRPEDVASADQEKYKLLNEEVLRDFSSQSGNIEIENTGHSLTPTIDSLSEIYTISRSIADQLFDISSDFYAFFEDDSSRRKAEFWASLSYKYFPYDLKYFDNHIYILEASGKVSEAQQVKQEMAALPWYQEMKTKARSATF